MLLACNRGLGNNLGFPDVCNTPTPAGPVPIPYPNIAMNVQAMPFSVTVKICMMNALNMATKILMTSADEAGSAGPIKGPGSYTRGSPNVKIDALPAITLTCQTTGNNMNNGLGAVLVPSAVNVLFSYLDPSSERDYASPREIGEAAMIALASGESGIEAELVAPGVGKITLGVFTADAPTRLYRAVRSLEALGAERLVLDLRASPGGDVEACTAIIEEFLDEGDVVAIAREDDGDETPKRCPVRGSYRMPLAVLVSERTASAAELLAGSLQVHERAVIIGARTFGKGLAQRLAPSATSHEIVYATALEMLLPDGRAIDGVGIEPDVVTDDPIAAALEALSAAPPCSSPRASEGSPEALAG